MSDPGPSDTVPPIADEFLITVGKLTQNASLTDTYLFGAFRVLAGYGLDQLSLDRAKAVYFTFESLPAKKQLVRRLLNVSSTQQEKDAVEALISTVESAHNPRNELAHSQLNFEINPDGSLAAHRFNPRHQQQANKRVTKPYLVSLMKQSGEARLAADTAYSLFCSLRGVPASIVM